MTIVGITTGFHIQLRAYLCQDCDVPVEEFVIDVVAPEFVKFRIDSYYGAGGGLQYFGIGIGLSSEIFLI